MEVPCNRDNKCKGRVAVGISVKTTYGCELLRGHKGEHHSCENGYCIMWGKK